MKTAPKLKSIRFRFMKIQVVSILLPLVLLSAFSLYFLVGFYQELQREKLEAHARSQAVEAGQLIEGLTNELEKIDCFSGHSLTDPAADPAPFLAELRRYTSSFPKISYLSPAGEELLKIVTGRERVELVDQGRSQAFQEALARPNQVVVTITEADPDFTAPALIFTLVLTDATAAQRYGGLQATIPLPSFIKCFSSRHVEDAVKQILIDEHGRILLHPSPERIFLPLFSGGEQLRAVTGFSGTNRVGFAEGLVDDVESYYAFAGLPEQPLAALAVLPKSNFRQLLRQLSHYGVLIALAGLLVGTIWAYFLGRPLLENIGKIKRQTQRLAEGKLDQRVSLKSGDELEDLAGAVNLLTERLVQTGRARDSLDLMLCSVIDPLVFVDKNGQIIKTNPAAQDLFGITEVDLVGQFLHCFFAPASPLAEPDKLQELFRAENLSNFETEIQLRQKKNLPVLFSSAHSENAADDFFVCIFKDISEQKRAEKKIARLAYYDTLTGLPNRTLLRNRLDKSLLMAERDFHDGFFFGLMFLDLDHFKVVNDTLGHSVGDQLLQSAAERLKDCLRRSDTISRPEDGTARPAEQEQMLARLGGDEFIVLLPRLRCAEDAALIARRIIEDMSKPFLLGHQEVVTPASLGIALYPDDGKDVDTLLRHADVAMYHAKEKGRNSYYFYSEEMNQSARDRLVLENRLRADIENKKGFALVYQPKIDMRTNQVCGMEALVRWENQELGMVSPARFIPIAEESGLIVPLGRWILQTACEQLKAWLTQSDQPLKIAVNLSGRQLKQPDLVPMVAEVLEKTGLDPALLELELTESMLMETVENTIELLQQLKDLGVSLAIDDFGTGYSSLSYLTRFPIDTLKIDRSFVNDLESDQNDATIVEAIVVMAHSLELQVVAEGVENEFQRHFLQERHCDQFQGFLFSKPVSAAEFASRFL